MTEDNMFCVLRAVAALEVGLDTLVAEKVAEARHQHEPMSWDLIAKAMGVARPTAWRRWKGVVDSPGPTGSVRRDVDQLGLSEQAKEEVQHLATVLVRRLVDPEDAHPWSTALRTALARLAISSTMTRRSTTESEFQFVYRDGKILISCLEPGPDGGAGGLVATLQPSAASSLRANLQPVSASLAPEGLLPVSGEALVQDVKDFIEAQINQAEAMWGTVPPGPASK